MPVHNEDIASVFDEIADLLEIEGDNPFRIRAYRNGARTLLELGRDINVLIERGEDITRLSGIGKNLAGKIHEVLETGHCQALDKLSLVHSAERKEPRRRLTPEELAKLAPNMRKPMACSTREQSSQLT